MTRMALEWFLIVVDEHVSLQLIRIGEFGWAQVTRVRLFAGVNAQMATQIGHLYEFSVAVIAMVWFFPCVQAHVSLQVMVTCEAFFTCDARERLFSSVGAFVVL